ncbi:hypothetical protein NE237_027980 [Protea cynaroides]|uniref:NAC domain-containing protein n=1 Tax=Protea cynaroides TaxID=273540 RepID=A0A9Q0GP04_9MAGN|nr:hypothetical protein NE237_027980 [Protea cynaroides]
MFPAASRVERRQRRKTEEGRIKKKICRRRVKLDVIRELDVYKWEPEELQGQSLLKTGDRQWFFFSPRDRRYPNGGRLNRATRQGYWKSTGRDRNIICNNRTVGVKKTLVFYKGRAPSGERTDWVMHEYTMDEAELNRCQTAQDSFALYKAFKKSGAGPKNGEQYGEPFMEEKWADDDDPVDTMQPLNVIPFGNSFTNYEEERLVENDREVILERIVDDPKVDQPRIDEFAHLLHQGGCEEILSIMGDPSLGEAICTEPRIVLLPGGQQPVAQSSFEATQSAISNMYSYEAAEVTSVPTISKQDLHAVEDDFLEMDDLLGPETSFPEMRNACEISQLQETNGLDGSGPEFPERGNACEISQLQETNGLDGPDLYFDAAMFLQDLGPIDQGMMPQYFVTLQGDMERELNYQLSSQTDDTNNASSELWTYEQRSSIVASPGSNQVMVEQGTTSQAYFSALQGDMASTSYYQLPFQSNDTNNGNSELWTDDQIFSIFSSPGSNEVVFAPPTSGLEHTGSSSNLVVETTQNQGGNEIESQDSWISSKLWGFLESIPTTPASASESALINRAFERISSFSRVRINANDMDGTATGGTPNVRRTGGSRGFGFLSFLGVMRPVLWVLMLSTTVKLLSTFLGRFLPW